MKKSITMVFMFSILILSSCKSKNKDAAAQDSSQPQQSSSGSKPEVTNQPKEYKVTVTPDSAILGKDKEAFLKIMGGKAVSLQDPDGKDNGTELTINLNVTNKKAIGSSSVSVSYGDLRLQLDNGTNITCTRGTDFLNAEPEATSKTQTWTYVIPVGAKPVGLNLFMDQTRVSVKIALD